MIPALCLVRGAGDVASGAIWRMARAGWPVVATELEAPLTVRRSVAFSTAVFDGEVEIEGVRAVRCQSPDEAVDIAGAGVVAVMVYPGLPNLDAAVVVDARLAKRNIDTSIDDADLVIALGPGFIAGQDCHGVVETMRGPRLGRVIWAGEAEPNTGIPGIVGGRGAERVLRAAGPGSIQWQVTIGDAVEKGQLLGHVGEVAVLAPFAGVVRGLISEAVRAHEGLKIGDIDSRCDRSTCFEISDKALAVGGGVLEAILSRSVTA